MADRITDAELDVIERRCAAATPGPWIRWFVTTIGETIQIATGFLFVKSDKGTKADAVFIAAARTDLPRVIQELRRERADNDRLRRGEFTAEEFQNLCHSIETKPGVSFEEFCDGCHAYQKKLFGTSERERLSLRELKAYLPAAAHDAAAALAVKEKMKETNYGAVPNKGGDAQWGVHAEPTQQE
jgi:hypothetical protein